MGFRRFEEIESWQLARELTSAVYRIGNGDRFRNLALREQIGRAAISVMANIAEGFGRSSDSDFARFLTIARGSALEVQSHLYVALDLGYLAREQFEELYGQAGKIYQKLGGLSTSRVRGPKSGHGRLAVAWACGMC